MKGLGHSLNALFLGGGRAMLLLAPLASLGANYGGVRGLAIGVVAANLPAGACALALMSRHGLETREGGGPDFDLSECE